MIEGHLHRSFARGQAHAHTHTERERERERERGERGGRERQRLTDGYMHG